MEKHSNKKGLKGFFIILAISAVFCILYYFVRPFLVDWVSTSYSSLDYDSVLNDPEKFNGEMCSLDGRIVQILEVAPDVKTEYSFFRVSEIDNSEHIWFVYGKVSNSDLQKMKEGMDMTISGPCIGCHTYKSAAGFENTIPAIYFWSYDFGYKFQSSDSVKQIVPADDEAMPIGILELELETTAETSEVLLEAVETEPDIETVLDIEEVIPEAVETLSDLEKLELEVAERTQRFRDLLNSRDEETENPELAALRENYVLWYTVNTSTKVIHRNSCYMVKQISNENKSYTDDPASLIAEGYRWCEICH